MDVDQIMGTADGDAGSSDSSSGASHDLGKRQKWLYRLTEPISKHSWIGCPLVAVLDRITADSGGVHTFSHQRAYRHAREATKILREHAASGKIGAPTLPRHHAFEISREHKRDVDWKELLSRPNTTRVGLNCDDDDERRGNVTK